MVKIYKNCYILAFCLLYMLNNNFVYSQKATAKISPQKFLIGDQAEIKITFQAKKGQNFLWPFFNDTASTYKIEVIDRGKIDTVKTESSDMISYSQKLIITTFDTGFISLSPIQFYALDSTLLAATDSLLMEVNTIPVDTNQAFKDIKDPLGESIKFSEILPWLSLGLGIAFIIFAIIYYIIRRKKNKPLFVLSKQKELKPHEFALEALESLRNKKLWQNGRVKEYYINLTEIIRIYIVNQFDIDALEMTSSEILDSLKLKDIDSSLTSKLKQILETSDLVKFAKSEPLPNENDLYINYAFDFVKCTIPKIIEDVTDNDSSTKNQSL